MTLSKVNSDRRAAEAGRNYISMFMKVIAVILNLDLVFLLFTIMMVLSFHICTEHCSLTHNNQANIISTR